jgi:group I intron endonuclease
MIVYKTVNLINGKFYIGKDRYSNSSYLGSGLNLKKAVKKYGRSSFLKVTLEVCEAVPQLNEAEKFWIKTYDAVDSKDGYNIAEGGHGGKTGCNRLSEETKLKISEAHKGKIPWNKGLTKDDERVAKYISNFLNSSRMTGKTLSQSARAKISDANKGKPKSDEHRKRISASMKGLIW